MSSCLTRAILGPWVVRWLAGTDLPKAVESTVVHLSEVEAEAADDESPERILLRRSLCRWIVEGRRVHDAALVLQQHVLDRRRAQLERLLAATRARAEDAFDRRGR